MFSSHVGGYKDDVDYGVDSDVDSEVTRALTLVKMTAAIKRTSWFFLFSLGETPGERGMEGGHEF